MLLQQKYREEAVMTIANVAAVPLYLHCLRKAAPELQLRGLQIWRKLLHSNMANLSASDRLGPGTLDAHFERLAYSSC